MARGRSALRGGGSVGSSSSTGPGGLPFEVPADRDRSRVKPLSAQKLARVRSPGSGRSPGWCAGSSSAPANIARARLGHQLDRPTSKRWRCRRENPCSTAAAVTDNWPEATLRQQRGLGTCPPTNPTRRRRPAIAASGLALRAPPSRRPPANPQAPGWDICPDSEDISPGTYVVNPDTPLSAEIVVFGAERVKRGAYERSAGARRWVNSGQLRPYLAVRRSPRRSPQLPRGGPEQLHWIRTGDPVGEVVEACLSTKPSPDMPATIEEVEQGLRVDDHAVGLL